MENRRKEKEAFITTTVTVLLYITDQNVHGNHLKANVSTGVSVVAQNSLNMSSCSFQRAFVLMLLSSLFDLFCPANFSFRASFSVCCSMLDAAEVLLGSIRRACGVSSYRCETVAFVLPSVPEAGKGLVRDMGWK